MRVMMITEKLYAKAFMWKIDRLFLTKAYQEWFITLWIDVVIISFWWRQYSSKSLYNKFKNYFNIKIFINEKKVTEICINFSSCLVFFSYIINIILFTEKKFYNVLMFTLSLLYSSMEFGVKCNVIQNLYIFILSANFLSI
jgi:hypothetical protein